MLKRAIVAALAIVGITAAPAFAHDFTQRSDVQYAEGCGWTNWPICYVHKIDEVRQHGTAPEAGGPSDYSYFSVLAGIYVSPINSPENVTRLRVCLGYNGYGIVVCDDQTRSVQEGGVSSVGILGWSEHSTLCGWYIQKEGWGVNFHMPFSQTRFPGC